MSSTPTHIRIYVSNGNGFVFTPEEVHTLRAKYNITGTLIGTLPSASQQNIFLGLPLLLLPEELVLLVDKGVALLVDDIVAHDVLPYRVSGSPVPTEAKTPSTSFVKPHAVTIPTTSSVLPWYPSSDKNSAFATASPVTASLLQHQHEYKTLESARQVGLWTYPSTQEERARCAVFRDLHEKGYWMGGGLKFGGDWLVYPGDPLRYHSHFVATVYPTPTAALRPMEIVALGRLGTGTKKSHLLCGWDEATGKVDYYSIEWAGFG